MLRVLPSLEPQRVNKWFTLVQVLSIKIVTLLINAINRVNTTFAFAKKLIYPQKMFQAYFKVQKQQFYVSVSWENVAPCTLLVSSALLFKQTKTVIISNSRNRFFFFTKFLGRVHGCCLRYWEGRRGISHLYLRNTPEILNSVVALLEHLLGSTAHIVSSQESDLPLILNVRWVRLTAYSVAPSRLRSQEEQYDVGLLKRRSNWLQATFWRHFRRRLQSGLGRSRIGTAISDVCVRRPTSAIKSTGRASIHMWIRRHKYVGVHGVRRRSTMQFWSPCTT